MPYLAGVTDACRDFRKTPAACPTCAMFARQVHGMRPEEWENARRRYVPTNRPVRERQPSVGRRRASRATLWTVHVAPTFHEDFTRDCARWYRHLYEHRADVRGHVAGLEPEWLRAIACEVRFGATVQPQTHARQLAAAILGVNVDTFYDSRPQRAPEKGAGSRRATVNIDPGEPLERETRKRAR
jgi:hypothetical protein